MKKADRHGVVHLTDYIAKYSSSCQWLAVSNAAVHHDTPITCLICIATLPGPLRTHKVRRSDGATLKNHLGYPLSVCFDLPIDSICVDEDNPTCAMCSQINEKNR